MEKTNPVDPLYRIWPAFPASGLSEAGVLRWKICSCSRAGGGYTITLDATSLLNHRLVCPMSDSERDQIRARLTTILVDMRQAGEDFPLVTYVVVKEAMTRPDHTFCERADRLLRFLANQEELFQAVPQINREGNPTSDPERLAMAWSESTTLKEVNSLLEDLVKRNLVIRLERTYYRLTLAGRSYLTDLAAR